MSQSNRNNGRNAAIRVLSAAIILFASIATIGCSSGDGDNIIISEVKINATPTTINLSDSTTQQDTLVVTLENGTNCDFTVSSSESWLNVSPTSGKGTLTATVSASSYNLSPSIHRGSITIECPTAINSPVTVSVNYERLRGLVLNPRDLYFDALEGGELPTQRKISILQAVSWHVCEKPTRYSVSSLTGTGDATIDVGPNTTDLEPGTYIDTITICAGDILNSPQDVIVKYVVNPNEPRICINPSNRNFWALQNGQVPSPSTFEIKNCGGKTLDWYIDFDCSWLRLSAERGSVESGGSTVVTLQPTRTNLEFGQHSCNVDVLSSNAGVDKETLNIEYSIEGPEIELKPAELEFEALQSRSAPEAQTVTIKNVGPGAFSSVSVDCGDDWVSIYPKEVPNPLANELVISIKPNTTDLAAKLHSSEVTVHVPNAENNPQKVLVSYSIKGPEIFVDPDSLGFQVVKDGPLPSPKALTVKNIGGGILNWYIADNADWLELSPPSGKADNVSDGVVNVRVTRTDHEPGTYSAVIAVRSEDHDIPEKNIPVTLAVEPGPQLDVNPSELRFAAIFEQDFPPAKEKFTISNSGGGDLQWGVDPECDWVSVSKTSELSNSAEVEVWPNRTDLPVGVHRCKIEVSSVNAENSPQYIEVVYTISAKPPELCIELRLPYGSTDCIEVQQGSNDLPVAYLVILNCGGGSLQWSITEVPYFLNVNRTSGVDDDLLVVKPKTSDLPVGVYSGKIKVIAPDAVTTEVEVDVCLEILP